MRFGLTGKQPLASQASGVLQSKQSNIEGVHDMSSAREGKACVGVDV